MTVPFITVLITTHNYGRFIEEAIDSVLSQDFPADHLEVIVVDDGSTDDTAERVRKYGSKVRFFYQPNGGQASALNLGFAEARGEIIALLDADDFFLPGRLAHISQAFQQDPGLGMVYHRPQPWDMRTDKRPDFPFHPVSGDFNKAPNQFLLYDPPPTSCVSLRRAVLDPLLPIPEHIRMLADAYLVDLIPFLSPILAIPEFLTVYRIHGHNSFFTDERQMPVAVRKSRLPMWQCVFDAMRKWLADIGYSKKQPHVRAFLNRWSLRLEEEQFLIDPPGRLRFFLFLMQQNRAHSALQTWRLTAFNYLSAFSALLFGYKNAGLMYDWRGRTMQSTQRLLGKLLQSGK